MKRSFLSGSGAQTIRLFKRTRQSYHTNRPTPRQYFRSISSVGSVVEDKLFRLSLPLGLHIQYEGDVLHSRSPSLSTRGILRESDILVCLAASVLVSISESLPCGRTRRTSIQREQTGDGARSRPAPFPFVAIFHPFAWQLTSTCNERISFSPAGRPVRQPEPVQACLWQGQRPAHS
jgi:hypothetical protein